ncbi:hypothetical protein SAMN05192568_10101, partial [Methylobacterium pseudosasicola]
MPVELVVLIELAGALACAAGTVELVAGIAVALAVTGRVPTDALPLAAFVVLVELGAVPVALGAAPAGFGDTGALAVGLVVPAEPVDGAAAWDVALAAAAGRVPVVVLPIAEFV